MNKKSWLIVGLSLAMAASIGVGISACGGETHTHEYTKWQYDADQHWKVCPADDAMDPAGKSAHDFTNGDCECGAKKPEHNHTYDAWDYNETQHWKYCDEHGTDKSNIDETTKANHSFGQDGKCECGYEEPAVYLVGNIASKPGSMLPSSFRQAGLNVTEAVRKNCIKMELGEDGETYEAEVFLKTTDQFKVYECSSTSEYPQNVSWVSVSENNGYLVSWKPGDAEPTFRVHDHKFEKYASDASQHWKVCPLDGTVEPGVEKQDHDFTQGDCVCGQKAPEGCKHENGFSFAYTELPEANADGGTLQKICPDCSATEDVHYDKGFGTACNTGTGNKTVLTDAGTYYLRGTNGFRFEATQAGTYTFRFEGKLSPTMQDVKLHT